MQLTEQLGGVGAPRGDHRRSCVAPDCHYGNTLRDEDAGWSVDRAGRERNVQSSRIVELREAVRRVADGDFSRTKAQAGHEDGVLRAMLHFRGQMSEGLRQHVDTRLARLKAQFIPGP